MSNITIYTDSTGDIPTSWLDEHNVKCINLTYIMDDEEHTDDPSPEKVKEFYTNIREGKSSKTSAISVQTFIDCFEAELKAGNDVFYTGLSGKLSGTCNNAFMAMEQLNKEYSNNQVYVTDSLGTSIPLYYMIMKAVEMRDRGKSAQDIVDALDDMKHRIMVFISVDDLMHLKRGGRISGAAAAIGTVLNIKPIIILDKDGGLSVKDKVKGRKKVMKYFIDKIEKYAEDPTNQPIFIIHTDDPPIAEEFKEMCIKQFGTKEFIVNQIGSIVGAHLGPGSLAMGFPAKFTREEIQAKEK